MVRTVVYLSDGNLDSFYSGLYSVGTPVMHYYPLTIWH